MHTIKNAKYIFSRFNSYLESIHQNKQVIRHTKKVEGKVGLEKIQNKNWQYLVEKIISHIENQKNQTQLNENE